MVSVSGKRLPSLHRIERDGMETSTHKENAFHHVEWGAFTTRPCSRKDIAGLLGFSYFGSRTYNQEPLSNLRERFLGFVRALHAPIMVPQLLRTAFPHSGGEDHEGCWAAMLTLCAAQEIAKGDGQGQDRVVRCRLPQWIP